MPQQRRGQVIRWCLAHATGTYLLIPDVNQAAQKGASGQDCCARCEHTPIHKGNRRQTTLLDHKVSSFAFNDPKIVGIADRRLHGLSIKLAVSLRPWSANGRALATVQKAELDSAKVRSTGHHTVERVNFANEMAFAQAANSWIA